MKSVTTALVTLVVVVYAVVGGVVFQLLERDNEEAIRVDVHQRLDAFLGPYARHLRHRYRWGGNVTSVGWQLTLCDPMRHVSSRSDVATLRTAIHTCYLLTLHSATVASFRFISMPAGFRRHLVGKTLRNVCCHCDTA